MKVTTISPFMERFFTVMETKIFLFSVMFMTGFGCDNYLEYPYQIKVINLSNESCLVFK